MILANLVCKLKNTKIQTPDEMHKNWPAEVSYCAGKIDVDLGDNPSKME